MDYLNVLPGTRISACKEMTVDPENPLPSSSSISGATQQNRWNKTNPNQRNVSTLNGWQQLQGWNHFKERIKLQSATWHVWPLTLRQGMKFLPKKDM